jgi:3-oxoacyl-[acyl-carrier-protein] synthase-3
MNITTNPPAEGSAVLNRSVTIIGTGAYVPERILTNADLEKMVDTTDEWIVSRSGIRERHIARADEATSDMAAEASRRALAQAGVSAEEVDLIIVATITPDMVFPSTACFVQNLIGAKKATCFDLEAACSGFLYAMNVATQFIKTGAVKTAYCLAMGLGLWFCAPVRRRRGFWRR